ncbi:MAG: hypothetical protein E7E18_05865 [Eubacterium sp.]|nr:hypothetical protein [Eubacterium sp.]
MKKINNLPKQLRCMSSVRTQKMPMKLSSNINNSILTRKHSNVIFEPRGDDNVENK